MTITDGNYRAKAAGEVVVGESSKRGTPYIKCQFEVLHGPFAKTHVIWTGYFTPNTTARTHQSLRICGWKGTNLGEFLDGELHGLDANEVEIVVENEDYETAGGESRTSARVAWVNSGTGRINVDNKMGPAKLSAFALKMKGEFLKLDRLAGDAPPVVAQGRPLKKAKPFVPVVDDDDDPIPF